MPLFTFSSGVQINGGSFYDIAGDMNVQSPPRDSESQAALVFGSAAGANRLLSGPDGNDRDNSGAAKNLLPYDVSHRPNILPSQSSWSRYGHGVTSLSTPPLVNPSIHPTGLESQSSVDVLNLYPHATDDASDHLRQRPPLGYLPVSSELISEAPLNSNVTVVDPLVFPWNNASHEPRTNINGGTFIGGDVNHIQRDGERGMHILYCAAANDASHDSGDRYPQPRCHPETRTEILADLHAWSSGDDPGSRILWLHGPAGAGKSAIAQSLCQKLEAEGRLGASFFFKRGHPSRGHAMKLFPTIAYHLALLNPNFKRAMVECVETNPSIVNKSLSIQLQKLIVEPGRDSLPTCAFVIVLDGLDECEGQNLQQEILHSIGDARQQLPVRFFIASRPEPYIVEAFHKPCLEGFHCPFGIQQSFNDVRTFFEDEFARIHQEHYETMVTVATPWPSRRTIDQLVEKSSGYFIYASTVIKFIDDKNFRPTDRLEIIMGIVEPDFGSPFSALDQLYTQILTAVPARPQLLRILSVIAAKLNLSVTHIDQLLGLKPGDVRLALRGLHSVIDVPQLADTNTAITVHHASFLDFLNDPTRSSTFHVGAFHRHSLACDILKALSYDHNDSSVNTIGHVAWELVPRAFKCLTSQWSPELVPHLHTFNPDYVFSAQLPAQSVETILDWLKNILPLPEALIQVWEEYRFMLLCHSLWWRITAPLWWRLTGPKFDSKDSVEWELQKTHLVLLQASPQLVKILHVYRVHVHKAGAVPTSLLPTFRLLLNCSWDDFRKAICSLREIGRDDETELEKLFITASNPTLVRELLPDSTMRDLANGWLQVMKKIDICELSYQLRPSSTPWGYLLRSCPPCPDLLQNLCQIQGEATPDPNDSHNTIQWLKTFPQPPPELLARFEQHQENSDKLWPFRRYAFDGAEEKWLTWKIWMNL